VIRNTIKTSFFGFQAARGSPLLPLSHASLSCAVFCNFKEDCVSRSDRIEIGLLLCLSFYHKTLAVPRQIALLTVNVQHCSFFGRQHSNLDFMPLIIVMFATGMVTQHILTAH
jgi:hypothetical protein